MTFVIFNSRYIFPVLELSLLAFKMIPWYWLHSSFYSIFSFSDRTIHCYCFVFTSLTLNSSMIIDDEIKLLETHNTGHSHSVSLENTALFLANWLLTDIEWNPEKCWSFWPSSGKSQLTPDVTNWLRSNRRRCLFISLNEKLDWTVIAKKPQQCWDDVVKNRSLTMSKPSIFILFLMKRKSLRKLEVSGYKIGLKCWGGGE